MPRDLSTAAIAQAVASSGRFALTLTLVWLLGLEQFGVVAIVQLVAGYCAGLVQAVFAQPMHSIATLRSRGSKGRTQALDAGVVGALVLAVALGGVCAAAACGLGQVRGCAIVFGLVAAHASYIALRTRLFVEASGVWVVMTDAIATWGALVLVVALPAGAEIALVSLMLATLVAALVSAVVVPVRSVAVRRLRVLWGRMWKSGRWLAGTQIGSWLGTGGLHAANYALVGPAGVGALRAAQGVVGAALALVQALELALPERAAYAIRAGSLGQWTRRMATVVCVPLLLAGLVVAVAAGPLSDLVFGSAAEGVAPLLATLAWLPAIAALTSILQVGLRGVERTRPILGCYLVAAVVALLVAVPLVHGLGARGAAVGLVLQQMVFVGMLWVNGGVNRSPTRSSGSPRDTLAPTQ